MDLDETVEYVNNNKKKVILISVIVVILLCIYGLRKYYYYQLYKNIDDSRSLVLYQREPVNSFGRSPVSPTEFVQPTIYGTSSYSMWLYIQEWYANYGLWKHIFHRGTPVKPNCNVRIAWNTVEDQGPGLWFDKHTNNLRIAFTTRMTVTTSCNPKKTKTTKIIEFTEIKNIPVQKWFQFGIVLDNRKLECYVNGLLHHTFVFEGDPVLTREAGFFGLGSTYAGQIGNFRYMPLALSNTEMYNLYSRENNYYSRK